MTTVTEVAVVAPNRRLGPTGADLRAPAAVPDGRPGADRRRLSYVVGGVEAVLTALFYAAGWDRAFSFDASRTVDQFVAVDSLGQVFGQDRFNNHPLFSLADHAVYRLTGTADERVLRLLPILLGALTVGLVAAVVVRHFGALAGAAAGATLAVNSLAVRHFREVRGYSLVTLAAVIATLLVFQRMRSRRPALTAAYTLTLAVAIGTHLFVLGLIGLHLIIVAFTPASRIRHWLLPWAAALTAGLAVQWPAIHDGLTTPPAQRFNPTFPAALAANLLSGGPATPAMILLVAAGWATLRSRPWVPWVVAGTAAMAGAAWLGAPTWLSSRYFTWLLPATAVAVGAAIHHRPRLAYLAGASVLAQLAALTPTLTTDETPNRIAATHIHTAHQHHLHVCALGRTRAGLRAYTGHLPTIWYAAQLTGCDLAIDAAGSGHEPLLAAACHHYTHHLHLPARHPGTLFAHQPLPTPNPTHHQWTPTTGSNLCAHAQHTTTTTLDSTPG